MNVPIPVPLYETLLLFKEHNLISNEYNFQCQKSFAAKETLNRHVKIHTGERPHICNICGKSFIQATQLKAHQFQHSRDYGFSCDMCEMKFGRKMLLKAHLENVHGKEEQQTKQQQSQQKSKLKEMPLKPETITGPTMHLNIEMPASTKKPKILNSSNKETSNEVGMYHLFLMSS